MPTARSELTSEHPSTTELGKALITTGVNQSAYGRPRGALSSRALHCATTCTHLSIMLPPCFYCVPAGGAYRILASQHVDLLKG